MLWIPLENICVGVSFYKAVGLKACNGIKKILEHNCFPVKIAKFLGTPFFKEFQWLLLRLQLMFSKQFGAKAGATVSSNYKIQLKKSICCREKPEAATVGALVKEGLQGPTQVFFCECWEIIKSSYFENICERLLLKISTSVANLPMGGNSWILLSF